MVIALLDMLKKLKKYCFNLLHPVIGEVWQLHRVTNEQSVQSHHRPYEITPARLESLIVEYQNKGYEFISIQEVAVRMSLESRVKSQEKFVAVTLDDGYADNYEIAYPIFKKYNIPFCIYLCEDMIIGRRREDEIESYQFLSFDQILKLNEEPLCTLGGHTKVHAHLNQLGREKQQEEVQSCKDWLENLIGTTVEDYAYPYGAYNQDTLTVMQSIDVKRAVAAWGGGVRYNTSKMVLCIPRVLVTENDIK